MLSSGIPILDALFNIEANSHDPKLKEMATALRKSVEGGHTFAESLGEMYGKTFGNVYISLVKTGEDSGELDVTLDRMLTILRKQEAIKEKIVNASIYPAVLLAMMFGLLVLFAKFVFPSFAGIMLNNGVDIPIMAQAIMGGIDFIGKFWWLIVISISALGYIFTSFGQDTGMKKSIDKFILKIPVISEFIEFINLSNFMTVLQISYDAGVPLMSGLELANKTVGNFVIKERVKEVIRNVKKGISLTDAFQKTKAIPDSLISMISAGEKSGTLCKMFKDAADVIDKKVDITLAALTRLFEPTIMVILGIVVLIIAVAFIQIYTGMLGSLV
jgi:type IV pilus assembly protein PilC